MASDDDVNTAERQRWNDAYWASVWPKREAMTSAVTDILLSHLDLPRGRAGARHRQRRRTTAIAAVDRVGAGGSVVGADISAPLVELARRRAADRQIPNLSFCVADAQRDTVPGAPFDAAVSQFGVMLFDEPVTAFANIRRHLAPGGRLAFACWQPIERNPWFVGPALADYAPTPPPPGPGKSPTCSFSLSEPERVGESLAGAGWTSIVRNPYELVAVVDRDAIVDDGQLGLEGVPEDAFATQARRAVEHQLRPLQTADGRIQAPLAVQIFTAHT